MRKAGDARTDPTVTSLSSDAGPVPTSGPAAPVSATARTRRTTVNNSMIPAGSTADHLEQRSPADRREHTGIGATALTPLAERIREAFDHADRADRFEQAILTPLPDDEYPLAY